nr:MAG TPA: hypothetical protein [Caudoviricetes sp.]
MPLYINTPFCTLAWIASPRNLVLRVGYPQRAASDHAICNSSHQYGGPCAQLLPRILTGGGISPPLPGAGELSGYKNFKKKDKKGLAIYMYM